MQTSHDSTATHMQHTAPHCDTSLISWWDIPMNYRQHTIARCNALPNTATQLQHTWISNGSLFSTALRITRCVMSRWQNISKVSSLLNSLQKITVELTFQNFVFVSRAALCAVDINSQTSALQSFWMANRVASRLFRIYTWCSTLEAAARLRKKILKSQLTTKFSK